MKKVIIGTVLLLTTTLSAFSQTKNITVAGRVIEDDTKEPAVQATVQLLSLPDSAFAAGIATTAQGYFTLPKVQAGKYVLKVSYIGFQPTVLPLQLSAQNPNKNVGTLALKTDAVMLAEAVITAEAPQVQVVEDTLMYNSSAYRTPEGAMLEELVKKLPGAEIDDDGNVKINGKELKKIMVDGKEFFGGDVKTGLKNLPVEMIDKLKTYDKQSDLARITGIDDGEEETVLDLTVKKGMNRGWFGNADAAVGTEDRYAARLNVNHFVDKTQVTVIGSTNNVNNQGFSGGGGGPRWRRNNGLNAPKELGISFATENKKIELGGSAQYNYNDADISNINSSERFLQNGNSYSNSNSVNRNKNSTFRADFRMEWKPDSMTNIIFRPNFSYGKTDNASSSLSGTFDADPFSLVANPNDYNYSAQITYSEPIARATFLQFSYQFQYKYSESDKTTYDLYQINPEWGIGEPLPTGYENHAVDSLGKYAEYRYYNHDASVSLRFIREKYQLSAGMSFQPQSSKLSYKKGNYMIDTTRSVFNFAPNVDFRYRFSKVSQLRFNYRGRTGQPSMENLLPIVDNSNPLNIRVGNPGLKPSFTHSMRLFYNTYNAELQRGIMTHASFSATQNSISNSTEYNEQTGGRTTTPKNINGNWSAFGMFGFNTALKNKKYTINSFSNINYQNNVAYLYNQETKVDDKNTTTGLTLSERLNGAYRNDWFEFGLNGSISYTAERNKLRPDNNQEPYTFSYGANTQLMAPWNMTFTTNIANQSRRGYTDSSMNRNELIWNAQLSQTFLKGAATISFEMYDILKQQSNISRSLTADGRSVSEYNGVNSYCMVHFIYRLNIFGNKAAREKMGRGGFGGPGGPGGHGGPGGRPGGFGGRRF